MITFEGINYFLNDIKDIDPNLLTKSITQKYWYYYYS